MKDNLEETLVVGVSSRALFDLEEENEIFLKEGVEGYRAFQREKEKEALRPGTAFYLVQSLLQLNQKVDGLLVNVVIMSRNSPETGLRVLRSIDEHQLDINRMAFTGGQPLSPYIDAFHINLFLSKDTHDVQTIIDSGTCAAACIYAPPEKFNPEGSIVKIAFDADAVLFSDDAEHRYKTEGIKAFHRHEAEHAEVPLREGPFAKLLLKLARIQKVLTVTDAITPLRIAIVTARSAPAHMRVINTLRHWGVDVDEAYFMGGLPKDKVLRSFGAHIFFDDQDIHLNSASKLVPAGRVPYQSNSPLQQNK